LLPPALRSNLRAIQSFRQRPLTAMRKSLLAFTALALSAAPLLAQDAPPPVVPKPAALVADGIPAVPQELAAATRPYMEFRTASFQDWDPRTRSMLISTRPASHRFRSLDDAPPDQLRG
jgi:hypothetical protein